MREDSSNLLERKNKGWSKRPFRNTPPTFWNLLKTLSIISAKNSATYWTTHWWHKCFHHIAIQSVIFLLHRRKNTLSKKEEWSQAHFQVSTERCRWYFSFGDKPSQSVRSINTNSAFAICQMLNYTKVATQGMGQGAWDKKHTSACGL